MKNRKLNEMLFPDENIPRPNESRIKQTVALGQNYMERNVPEKTPILSLFCEQVKYISPFLWVAQFAALIIILSMTISGEPNLLTAQSILFQLAPLAALFAVPELIKDSLYNMSELESSCKNSGSVILLMRLIVVGCINVTMLILFAGIIAGTWHQDFFSLILYAIVPYNCVNMICLAFIQILKIRGRSAALTVSVLSAVIVFILPMGIISLSNISNMTMLAVFIGTVTLLSIQMIRVFKSMPTGGHIAWN